MQSWADLPLDRPISINGVSANALALLIETLPADAPAVIGYTASARSRPAEIVTSLLVDLDRIARELFPAWLPEAEHLDSATGSAIAAVRSIALRAAQAGGQFGPFVADLAERSLRVRSLRARSGPAERVGPFDPEVRAAGLATVIAVAFHRRRTAVLIRVDERPTTEEWSALVAAARWFCDYGHFGIWFTGDELPVDDTVESVAFSPPTDRLSDDGAEPWPGDELAAGTLSYAAVAGRPHPGSAVEQALEAALATVGWAAGREWNQTYQPHPLRNPVRLDLLWRRERCVVEIDGAEHCQPARFAADRQRDVLLQLAGYAVLRFTNGQVMTQRDLVLAQIHQFLTGRRAGDLEGETYAGQTEARASAAGTAVHSHGGESRAVEPDHRERIRTGPEAGR